MATDYELQVRLQFDSPSSGPEGPPGHPLEGVPAFDRRSQAKLLIIHLSVNNEKASASGRKGFAAFMRGVDRILGFMRQVATYLAGYTLW